MNGIERIAQERQRQINLGCNEKHDDQHRFGELALVAALYAVEAVPNPNVMVIWQEASTYEGRIQFTQKDPWPWGRKWDKREKHDDLKKLTVAGALIAAEIDRRLRLGERPGSDEGKAKAPEMEKANPNLAGNPQRQMQSIVMGALFDFLGYLTALDQSLTLSRAYDPYPALERLKEWMDRRGLDHKNLPVHVQDWQNRIGLDSKAEKPAKEIHEDQD